MAEDSDITSGLERLRTRYQAARQHASKWRSEAKICYGYYANDQWSEEDKAILEEQRRPCITFNRAKVLIDAVIGYEVNNRQETRYIPRTQGDAKVNELLTNAADFFRDSCDAEYEESDAFRDTAICGMGWTEDRLSDDKNPEYDLVRERVDPFEMLWDPSSKKPNLADARYLIRKKWMSKDEVKAIFPDWDGQAVIDDIFADDEVGDEDPKKVNPHNSYKGDGLSGQTYRDIPVIEHQYYEKETVHIIVNPMTQERVELDDGQYRANKAQIDEFRALGAPYAKQKRTTYKREFWVGAENVKREDSPYKNGFTYGCITGMRDRNKGHWFGLMRVLIDPQQWSNKWLSQILHILNSGAKGGVILEKGAVDDVSKFEATWARSEAITWVKDGTLGANPRLLPKPQTQLPTGIEKLLEYANESFGQVSGVNQELLGMADREQPGVLEYQRKQSAVTLLAPLFDSLRRYRKMTGRCWLYFMQTYLQDGRLVRITADDEGEQEQYQPFVPGWNSPATAEYDVIVDQGSSAPNQKEATWAVLNTLLPIVGEGMGPDEIALALEYSPLPESFLEKYKQIQKQKAAQGPPPNPEMVKAQAMIQAKQAEMQLEAQKAAQDAQIKRDAAQADIEIERMKAAAEEQRQERQLAFEQRMAEMKAQADMRNSTVKANAQAQAAIITARNKPKPKAQMGAS